MNKCLNNTVFIGISEFGEFYHLFLAFLAGFNGNVIIVITHGQKHLAKMLLQFIRVICPRTKISMIEQEEYVSRNKLLKNFGLCRTEVVHLRQLTEYFSENIHIIKSKEITRLINYCNKNLVELFLCKFIKYKRLNMDDPLCIIWNRNASYQAQRNTDNTTIHRAIELMKNKISNKTQFILIGEKHDNLIIDAKLKEITVFTEHYSRCKIFSRKNGVLNQLYFFLSYLSQNLQIFHQLV